MRGLFFIMLFYICDASMLAQDEFVKNMNDIKLSGEYYTAHCRDYSEETAYQICVRDILEQIKLNHQGSYDEAFVRNKSMRMINEGKPCRVFVYLKKTAVSQTMVEDSKLVVKNDIPTEEVFKRQVIQPAPALEPNPIQPKVEQVSLPLPQPMKEHAINVEQRERLVLDIVRDLMARNGISKAYDSFKAKKDIGIVSDYGILKNVQDTDFVYIVIYDNDAQAPCAILTPLEGGNRKNLVSGSQDTFSNYHGVAAFWFTVK